MPLAMSISSGVAIIKDDKFHFANRIIQDYLGYDESELKKLSFFDLVDPDRLGDYIEYSEEGFFKEGDNISLEIPLLRKDGSRIWLRLFASMIMHNDDLVAIVTAFDNTEVREVNRELEVSEKKYKAVLNKNPNNIYLVDKETMMLVEANLALQKLTGYSEDELLGMKPYDFIAHESRDVDDKISSLDKNDFKIVGERKYKKKDGSMIDVEVNANIIDIGGKEFICVVSWDITERKRYEAELKDLNEVLRLTGRITRHDIRNKLAVSLGLLGLMREGHVDDLLVNEAFKAAQKAIEITKRMNELEAIALSKEEPKKYDLHEMVEMVIIDHPVKYRIHGRGNVYADDALISVIENIVGNAIAHGNADLIQVDIKEEEEFCRMMISDNGKGIIPEIREKLFDESFSFGESKGTGLGLYIVRKVIERYGGTVELSDPVLDGTTFMITLPTENGDNDKDLM